MVDLVRGKYPAVPALTNVQVITGFTIRVTFADGVEREIDLDSHMFGPVFEPIRRDPKMFASVRVDDESDTICWPNGADIAPETLYYEGEPPWVKDQRRTHSSRKKSTRRVMRPRAQKRKLRTKRLEQKA
ncbi:MAG: DUF2442 domain-containing protein [Chloroflexi bacterium]|nr:DUF2442 domain-containing protein [Chloroflexota bacterium]